MYGLTVEKNNYRILEEGGNFRAWEFYGTNCHLHLSVKKGLV